MSALKPNEIRMQFGTGIPGQLQGEIMLALETRIRAAHPELDALVFKETMGDDSKLRVQMTPEERARLP